MGSLGNFHQHPSSCATRSRVPRIFRTETGQTRTGKGICFPASKTCAPLHHASSRFVREVGNVGKDDCYLLQVRRRCTVGESAFRESLERDVRLCHSPTSATAMEKRTSRIHHMYKLPYPALVERRTSQRRRSLNLRKVHHQLLHCLNSTSRWTRRSTSY